MSLFKKMDKCSKNMMKFGIQLVIIGIGIIFLVAIIIAITLSH
jgi:Na+-transporting methylmalonyl-CoA/oxaloacetate decarboxylase gamma subunit